jgi:hypothetical protein
MDELELRRLYAKGAIDEATFNSQMQYIMQIKQSGLLGSQQGQAMSNGAVDTGWQPPKYEEPIRPNPINPMMGQQMGPATVEPEWQPPKYEVPPPRPVDPMRGQQMAPMPQAPEPTMPMMPMPSAEPSQMQMSPMPLGGGETTVGTVSSLDPNDPISIASNRAIAEQQNSYLPRGMGAPTQNETDFLGQFVDNAKKAMYR